MGYRSIISLMPKTAPVDADAQAFLTAAGITDPTISGAINTLVVQMKADNIWTKMKAIYPMVGGTASTHKWNLKDPRDLDAAFRLQFFGGWTHSANGANPNGTNGYANTFLNPSIELIKTNVHLSVYNRTNSNSSSYDMGNSDNFAATVTPTFLISKYVSNAYMGIADTSYGTSISSSDSRGFWCGATNGSSTQTLYKNGSSIKTGTQAAGNFANNNIYIGAQNGGGTASLFSDKQIAFASIGTGLSDTEAANFYTAVQAFQTTLNRQV